MNTPTAIQLGFRHWLETIRLLQAENARLKAEIAKLRGPSANVSGSWMDAGEVAEREEHSREAAS